jgi:hypothetical protein
MTAPDRFDEMARVSCGCMRCRRAHVFGTRDTGKHVEIAAALRKLDADARAEERQWVRDWINNNLGERSLTNLLMEITARGDR